MERDEEGQEYQHQWVVILNRVIRVSLVEKMTLEQLRKVRAFSLKTPGGRTSRAEGTARAK